MSSEKKNDPPEIWWLKATSHYTNSHKKGFQPMLQLLNNISRYDFWIHSAANVVRPFEDAIFFEIQTTQISVLLKGAKVKGIRQKRVQTIILIMFIHNWVDAFGLIRTSSRKNAISENDINFIRSNFITFEAIKCYCGRQIKSNL